MWPDSGTLEHNARNAQREDFSHQSILAWISALDVPGVSVIRMGAATRLYRHLGFGRGVLRWKNNTLIGLRVSENRLGVKSCIIPFHVLGSEKLLCHKITANKNHYWNWSDQIVIQIPMISASQKTYDMSDKSMLAPDCIYLYIHNFVLSLSSVISKRYMPVPFHANSGKRRSGAFWRAIAS